MLSHLTTFLALLALLALVPFAGCDTEDPDPIPTGSIAVIVEPDSVAPELPVGSINQVVSFGLLVANDYGAAVEVAAGCGVYATIQKQVGEAWEDVGEMGCNDDEPITVADDSGLSTDVDVPLSALGPGPLDGAYRLVLDVRTADEGTLLPDSMRTSDPFTVTEVPLYPTPEVFAPGVVSTGAEEYRIAFTPDGSRAYFARGDAFFPASRQAMIYETRRVGGAWTEPVVASFSGTYPDIDPFVTPDGERLYFSSIRPVDGAPRTDADVWYVEWEGDGWGEPVHTGDLNSPSDELYPSVADDGTLYVGSDRPGGLGGWDIWHAHPEGAGYGEAENVGAPVNTAAWEFNPAVSPDGAVLVFTGLNYPGGAGLGDLYQSGLGDEGWGAPSGVGSTVNTAADEFHPGFSPDRRLLFFVRRQTQGDLHVVSWPLAP
jgi:hypothetical protein